MERELDTAMGKPGFEDVALDTQAEVAAYDGQYAKAHELTHRAIDSAQHADEAETAAGYLVEEAVRDALIGNKAEAKQKILSLVKPGAGRDVAGVGAVALALAGENTQALRMVNEISQRTPDDTIVKVIYVPMVQSAVALNAGKGAQAVEALSISTTYDLGQPSQITSFNLYTVYLRGLAYLAAHQGTEATAEFQKIIDHPGLVATAPIGSLAYLQLGRAYMMAGDSVKARTAYQDFLALWKDADPDLPILKDAKAEYAKLK
jgi:Flp pilus assembly protein TadD